MWSAISSNINYYIIKCDQIYILNIRFINFIIEIVINFELLSCIDNWSILSWIKMILIYISYDDLDNSISIYKSIIHLYAHFISIHCINLSHISLLESDTYMLTWWTVLIWRLYHHVFLNVSKNYFPGYIYRGPPKIDKRNFWKKWVLQWLRYLLRDKISQFRIL